MPRGVQKINGVEYVYEYDSTWNVDKKYGTHQRNYTGKMVDGVFMPNKKYSLQQELEVEKKKFPGPVATTQCKRSFYGATYLFDAIGEKLGIVDDLKTCFPDTYQQVLSIAYYLIMEDRNPLSRFPKWASTHVHPFGNNYLPSAAVSCLVLFMKTVNKTSSLNRADADWRRSFLLTTRLQCPLIQKASNR